MNRSYADPDVWNVLAPSTPSITSTFHGVNGTSETVGGVGRFGAATQRTGSVPRVGGILLIFRGKPDAGDDMLMRFSRSRAGGR